ncbi:cAMP-dependent protein kinase regulatory subunit [[Candida] jaroonii]|uniref:cAMP-dependent protein kinase regulatory subunit n=1 Tax=[Candida] jaroonii TaxID=467808 RepID=A0ACA9Y3Q6_9ASCO|nr:cAMP-dependent protein kinase regulatory subunit [[Candida] jaroonii]
MRISHNRQGSKLTMTFITDELNQLQNEIISKNPVDIIQFCANYFNAKLELQRSYLWQQQSKAKSAGINLFPNIENVNMSSPIVNNRQPSFKSPFNDSDPHHPVSKFDDNDPTSIPSIPPSFSKSNESPGMSSGPFKSSVKEGIIFKDSTNDPKDMEVDHDPMDPNAIGPISEEGDPMTTTTKPKPLTNSKIPINFNVNRRISVSAEALNPDNFKSDDWKPPTNDLTPSQRNELFKSLSSNFLFQKLDISSQKTVVSALTKKSYKKGDEIIKQGEEGDYFYIIENGSVEFYVDNIERGSASEGSSFGELALMHNSPRAATVLAASEVVNCWALDRLTFRRILLEGTFNKRIMYENFLKEVKILKNLNNQEISKLADALTTEIYHANDKIVVEGEKGENFYFIESGNCEVIKNGDVVNKLTKGDYFGEIALLNDLPRQATVMAQDNVIVATLDKSGFQRLLGPAVDILKSNEPEHQ